MTKPLIDKHGGYRKLDSYTLACVAQLGAHRFCETFLNRRNDPCGRQFDQMTQAARFGRENMIEGSERAGTSKGSEMTLTDVGRASFGELKGDFEFWLLRLRKPAWRTHSPEAQAVYNTRLDDNPLHDGDGLHESMAYILAQYDKFAKWLDSDDSEVAANAMIVILSRVLRMLDRQMAAQGEAFRQEGGFRERMTAVRLEERDRQEADPDAPECPDCGKPMRRRMAKSGKNAGKPFWGCTGYPECHGARDMEGA